MPILNRSAPLGALLTLALVFTLTLAACDAADPVAPATATLPTASAAAKSDVCHYDADADTYHLINIADRAIDAHIAHGDARPGETVPGSNGDFAFDDACVPQPVFDCATVGGAEVGGACWFLGADGQSCTDVCNDTGLSYDQATLTYAGSEGNDANCNGVLDALGVQAAQFRPGVVDATSGIGCVFIPRSLFGPYRARGTQPPTSASAASFGAVRACACQ